MNCINSFLGIDSKTKEVLNLPIVMGAPQPI